MQHLIQKAIRDRIIANSAIVTFLTSGKSAPWNVVQANVFAEGDVRPEYPTPYIVLRFVRQRPGLRRNEFVQTWHIQVYNRDRGYYNVESQLDYIFNDFHEQQIDIDPTCPFFCLPTGIQYVSALRGYDPIFKTEFASAVIDIHLMRRNAA